MGISIITLLLNDFGMKWNIFHEPSYVTTRISSGPHSKIKFIFYDSVHAFFSRSLNIPLALVCLQSALSHPFSSLSILHFRFTARPFVLLAHRSRRPSHVRANVFQQFIYDYCIFIFTFLFFVAVFRVVFALSARIIIYFIVASNIYGKQRKRKWEKNVSCDVASSTLPMTATTASRTDSEMSAFHAVCCVLEHRTTTNNVYRSDVQFTPKPSTTKKTVSTQQKQHKKWQFIYLYCVYCMAFADMDCLYLYGRDRIHIARAISDIFVDDNDDSGVNVVVCVQRSLAREINEPPLREMGEINNKHLIIFYSPPSFALACTMHTLCK